MYTIFLKNIARNADNIALIDSDGKNYSYQAVNTIALKLCTYLIKQGVYPGQAVAVHLSDPKFYILFYLALSRINCSYIPFDADTGELQLHADIKTLKLTTIVTDSKAIEFGCPTTITINCKTILDEIESLATLPDGKHPKGATNFPTYIVGSSGTLENRLWVPIQEPLLDYWEELLLTQVNLQANDNFVSTINQAYDASIFELLCCVITGSTLKLVKPHQRRDILYLASICADYQITSLLVISSQITDGIRDIFLNRLQDAKVKRLFVTGDACLPELKAACELREIELLNCYGPKEIGFGFSIYSTNGCELTSTNTVPIGLSGTKEVIAHIIDGILHIESPHLSTGYINNPEETTLAFPTKTINGRQIRVFNTGDYFSQENGALIFHGKRHDKLSGVKCRTSDITHCLKAYNKHVGKLAITDSYVLTKNKRYVAYVTTNDLHHLDGLLDFLKQILLNELVPTIYVLDYIPRFQNSGKINHTALANRKDSANENLIALTLRHSSSNTSDDTTYQSAIKKITACILNLPLEAIDNNSDLYYELGADSFDIQQIIAIINVKFESEITYSQAINTKSSTINHLIKLLTQSHDTSNTMTHHIQQLTKESKSGKTVFMMPALLGDGTVSNKHLAKHMQQHMDCTVYGLNDPSLYADAELPNSLDHAADRYVKAIKTVQPHGPYTIAGFSYGSTHAYYVAKKLIQTGDQVDMLFLIDGFSPLYYQSLQRYNFTSHIMDCIQFVVMVLNNSFHRETIKPFNFFKLHPGIEKSEPCAQIRCAEQYLLSKVVHELSKRIIKLAAHHLIILINEKPGDRHQLDIPVRFLTSTDKQGYANSKYIRQHFKDPQQLTYWWSEYFKNVIHCYPHAFEGTHLEILEANANERGLSSIFDEPAKIQVKPFKTYYAITDSYYTITLAMLTATEYHDLIKRMRHTYSYDSTHIDLITDGKNYRRFYIVTLTLFSDLCGRDIESVLLSLGANFDCVNNPHKDKQKYLVSSSPKQRHTFILEFKFRKDITKLKLMIDTELAPGHLSTILTDNQNSNGTWHTADNQSTFTWNRLDEQEKETLFNYQVNDYIERFLTYIQYYLPENYHQANPILSLSKKEHDQWLSSITPDSASFPPILDDGVSDLIVIGSTADSHSNDDYVTFRMHGNNITLFNPKDRYIVEPAADNDPPNEYIAFGQDRSNTTLFASPYDSGFESSFSDTDGTDDIIGELQNNENKYVVFGPSRTRTDNHFSVIHQQHESTKRRNFSIPASDFFGHPTIYFNPENGDPLDNHTSKHKP